MNRSAPPSEAPPSQASPSEAPALDDTQQVQERQYAFPYHYIPEMDGGFRPVRYWSWGFRYLGGIAMALEAVERAPFSSLLDVGCGDGRFLREIRRRHDNADLLGVDYSPRAIALARAFNPDIAYRAADITAAPLTQCYDVITLIEVLEHIPPEEVPSFLAAITRNLSDGGRFIMTVPHANKAVSAKHYQHFTTGTLHETLRPHFRQVDIVPFDDIRSVPLKILFRLLGGGGGTYVITRRGLTDGFFRLYRQRYLRLNDERRAGRLLAICRDPLTD